MCIFNEFEVFKKNSHCHKFLPRMNFPTLNSYHSFYHSNVRIPKLGSFFMITTNFHYKNRGKGCKKEKIKLSF